MAGRPPALSDAQKRAITKMVKESVTVRNEIKRIAAEQVNKAISGLVFVPGTTEAPKPRKKYKKRKKRGKKAGKKAKAAKKKVAKKAKAKPAKKKKRKKSNRVYKAPTGKRQCKKCKKTMEVHPRSMDCPKCGAKKSLKKVK